MAVTPTTATAIMADQSRHRLRAAMDHLLYRLKAFVEARPMMQGDDLPKHDIVWVTYAHRGGPETAIADAIKSHPELWRDALPGGTVIVPRKALEQCGLSPDVVEALAMHGAHMVADQAARHEYDLRNRDE